MSLETLEIIANLLSPILEPFLDDVLKGWGQIGRLTLGQKLGDLRRSLANIMDYLEDATPHENVGISPDGIADAFEAMLFETAHLVPYIGSEIAEELYCEMIQEGLSNAIQFNIGGAVQSILNAWRGSYPLSYDEIDEVISVIEDLDSDISALLIAQAGANLPATHFRVKQGFDRYVDDQLIALRSQLQEIAHRMNDMIMFLHDRAFHLAIRELDESVLALRDAYERAIGLIDQACERTLARLFELKAELQTVKSFWEFTQEHPDTPLISEEEKNQTAIENKLEAEATVNSLNFVLSSIDEALANLTFDVTEVVNKAKEVIANVVSEYQKVIDQGWVDVSGILEKLDEIMTKVTAYRKSVELKTDLVKPTSATYFYYRPPTYPGELAPPVEKIEREVVEKVTLSDDVTIVVGEIKIKALDEQVNLSDETTTVLIAKQSLEEQVGVSDEVSVEVVPKEQALFTEEWNAQTPPTMYQVYREEWSG